jgi:hypothetical protein
VTKSLRQSRLTPIILDTLEPPTTAVTGDPILDALQQQPFSPVRESAKLTCISRSTVHRWVSHNLTATQKASRVTLSNQLFQDLCSIKHKEWQFIVTLDEASFDQSTDHEQMWLRSEEEPLERPPHPIQNPRMMVTIAWNPLGFHLLNALPKGGSFTAGYYRDNILADLVPLRQAGEERQLCLHADDARVYIAQKCRDFCRDNGLRILPHPLYSHDLAPSDFSLFGHVKQSLTEMTFASRDELFEAILSVVRKIPIETLHRVFDHWLERLDQVAKNNGEYYP